MRPRPPQPPPLDRARQRLASDEGPELDLSALGLTAEDLATLVEEPGVLDRLRQVRSLDLSDNRLAAVPEWVFQSEALEHLMIRRNELTTPPTGLDHLQTLAFEGNPIPPPREPAPPLPDWAVTEGAVVVHAVYFQYYVYDADDFMESWAELQDSAGDGLLAPSTSAVRVVSAVHTGNVHVQFRVAEHLEEPDGVAAATDLELPSGVLCLSGWEGGPVHRHDFGGPVRIRLLLEVAGRDHLVESRPPAEIQRMTVVRVDRARPRWRSPETDQIGESLRTVRDTARPWDAASEP